MNNFELLRNIPTPQSLQRPLLQCAEYASSASARLFVVASVFGIAAAATQLLGVGLKDLAGAAPSPLLA